MGVVSRSWDGGVNAGRDPAELRHALGVPIMPASLERALTHRSYAYENDNPPTNERLEFLGDSVLGLVVTDTLYRGYPNLPEGQLAKLRAAVVQMGALAEVARELSLGAYVKLGRGEQVTGGRNKPSILADTLEAVIGAVYIDCGLDEARALVHRLFDPVIARSARLGAGLDWKTSLQELTAVKMLGVPDYQVEESGPDHQKSFRATVRVGGQALGAGQGRTKKAAEQQAAVLVRVRPVRQRTLEPVMGNRDTKGSQQLRPVALAAARRSVPCGHGFPPPALRNQWIRVG